MSRRWWMRQARMCLLFAAAAGVFQLVLGNSWTRATLFAGAVLVMGGLGALNVLHAKRYRPEKFAKYQAIQEARLKW